MHGLLVLVAAFVAQDGRLFPNEGKPIVSVDIVVARSDRDDPGSARDLELVRQLLDIQPGYLYSTGDLSRGVRRVFALGRFTDVQVYVTPFQAPFNAVALEVRVTPQRTLGELTFSGDTDSDISRELKGGIAPGLSFDDVVKEQMRKRMEKLWESFGYAHTACSVNELPGKRGKIDVDLRCTRGEPAMVRAVELSGRLKAREQELVRELALTAGVLFTEKKLKADERALRAAYFRRGFLNAQVKSELLRQDGIVIRYNIDAGPRVTIRVLGNRRFKDGDLTGLLKRETEEPLSVTVLDAWRRAVIDKYTAHGFAQASALIKSYADHEREIVYHVLAIDEGKRYRVTRLAFPGAEFFDEARLGEEVSAIVNERLDPSLLSGELNKSAVRELEDSTVGIPSKPRIRSPGFDHWLYRYNPDLVYEPEAYTQAQDAIRRLYLEQGFTRVEIGPLALERHDDTGNLTITVPVREGPRALISVLTFVGSKALDSSTMLELATLRPGEPFSELAVEETRNAILKALRNKGHMFARVEPSIAFDGERAKAEAHFLVNDGPQVIVGRVLIQGNDDTQESVLRDRVLLEPGAPYSPEKAQTTKDDLQRLEVFDSTSVGLADPDAPAEQKDVLIRLLERKSQRIEWGIGVSTAQGLRGFIEYSDRNLFGRAQSFTLRLQLNRQLFFSPIFYGPYANSMDARFGNRELKDGSFGFSDNPTDFAFKSIERLLRATWRTPRSLKLPGRPQYYIEAGNERLNTLAFSLDSVTVLTGINLQPVSNLGIVLETGGAYNSLQCFPLDTGENQSGTSVSACDVRNFGRANFVPQGGYINWKSGTRIVLDFRDHPLTPQSGVIATLSTDLIVGQQVLAFQTLLPDDPRYSFIKAEAQVTGYVPAGKRAQFALSGRIGNIFRVTGTESLLRSQLNERFFMGGRNTLRGYYEQAVLPQDACVVVPGAPASACAHPENRVEYLPHSNAAPPVSPGAFYLLAKGEFRFPVLGDVRGAVFVDAGNLYFSAADFQPLAIRVNVGAGVRYETRAGSLALDLGFNPIPDPRRGEVINPLPYIYFGLF